MRSNAQSNLFRVVAFTLILFNLPLTSFFSEPMALSDGPPPPQIQITLFDAKSPPASFPMGATQSPELFPDAIIGVKAEWYRNNLPDEDLTFTAQIHYPFPQAEFFTDAEHAMTWGDYIDTCTHQADQQIVECTGRFPASDPTQIMLASVDFYILGTCELYPNPPASVTVEAEVQYSDETDDSTSESVPVAPRVDLVTVADSPANSAVDVVIESEGNGPLLQWHDNTSGYTCGPINAISPLDHDITYGVYLNASSQTPQQIGEQNGECSRQVQLAPTDLACDENGEPQVWEWTIRAVDIKYSVCTPAPVQDTTFRFTTASCQPEITQVTPKYGHQYFLKNIGVDNTYRVEVDWNGPAYHTPPSAPIDGQVHFEINGVEKPENGVDGQTWGAEHTFNMGQDFKADWSGGNNAMKIWAEYRPETGGPVYKSDYYTAQPIVFPFPEWATTIPIGPFTIDAKEAAIEYENEAQYPDPAFEANVEIPNAVPYLGGKELGILESQATAGIEASSAGTGKLSLAGETGLGLGAFEIVGEIGGEGEFKFQQNDGLKMEKATLELGISTPFKKEMTLADLVPAVKAAEDWWLVGKLIRKVTRSIVVEGSITPKISIAADFEQRGRTAWVFEGSVVRGQLELKVVATFKPYEKLWVQVYGGGTPFLEFNFPANPDYFRRMGIDLLFGAKLHAWRWDKEFKYGVTCALPGGCNSNDDLRRMVALSDTGWELLPRTYVDDTYNVFVGNAATLTAERAGTMTSASAATTEHPLVNNVYPLTEPALAIRADGHKTLAYIVDDPGKPLGQGEELAVLQGPTLTQTAPMTLTDDWQLDFAPQVVYDGEGNAVVAWERSYTDVITSGLNLTFAQQIDIAATVWMSDSASWDAITMLTENNERLDHSPRLRAGSDGSVMALWQSGDGTDILGTTAHPITYTYATWDSTSWSMPQIAIGGLSQTLEMDVAVYSSTQAALVYVVDTDGELATAADTELYYSHYDGSQWAVPQPLTNDTITDTTPALIYDAAGGLKLLWLRGTDLVMLDSSLNIADVQHVRADSTASGFQDLRLSRSPAGHLALAWQEMYADGADLAYSVYDASSGRWGMDQPFMHDAALETAFAPAFTDDGTLYLAYRKSVTEYVTDTVEVSPTLSMTVTNMPQLGRSDLYLLNHTVGRDLTISDLTVTPAYPAAGEAVTLTAQVHNVGDLETGPIDVRFDDGADAIITVTVAPTLTAGTWVTTTTTWSAPDPLTSPHTLRATVDPGDTIVETFKDNNTVEAMVFGARLVAETAQRYDDTETLTYTLTLRNAGSTSAEAPITVTLRADTPDGTVLSSTTLTTHINAGAWTSASVVIPDVSLLQGLNDGWMVAGTPQTDRDNAWPVSLQVLPDLIVSGIQEKPPTVQVANVGALAASGVDLAVWRDVTAASLGYTDTLVHDGTIIFSDTLGDLAPGQTIAVQLNLPSGEMPELWAQVDPQHAIQEGNEANNLKIRGITAIDPAPHLYVTTPSTATVGALTTLTATVGPPTITLPMTYTWQTTDYAPIVHPNGGLSDTLQIAWVTTGTKHVTVTGRNAAGDVVSDTDTLTVQEMPPGICVPLTAVTIDGPGTGIPDKAYRFTAAVGPTATRPIHYTWDPLPQPGSLILPTGQSWVTYTWDTPGTYTLTVTAQNCDGEGQETNTHTIQIQAQRNVIHLPLIQRGYVPPPTPDRYVKRYGEDSGDCSTPATACGSIQYALDQAQAGDLIGIAGYKDAYTLENPGGQHTRTYWDTQSRPKPEGYYGPDQVRQVALIEKSVTLYGGYGSDFRAWNPKIYKTVLRPGLSGGDGRQPHARVALYPGGGCHR